MTAAIVYVNTDNISGTEDGTSLATGYVTLAQALSSETATLTQDMTILCSGATLDTGGADTALDTNGFTLTIQGNRSESDGFYDGNLLYSTSHYRITNSSGFRCLRVDCKDSVVDGLQLLPPTIGNRDGLTIQLMSGASFGHIAKNNRIVIDGPALNQAGIFAGMGGVNNKTVYIQNNVIVGFDASVNEGFEAAWTSTWVTNCYITNNTIFNCTDGISIIANASSTSVCQIKNNAIANCTDDYILTTGSFTPTVTHNATDDGDGTSSQDLSPGTPESGEWPNHWTDPNNATVSSKDFTVVGGGALDDNGTTGTGIPTTDILGNSRHASTPDIGAFEETAGGAVEPVPRYRRSRQSTTTHSSRGSFPG